MKKFLHVGCGPKHKYQTTRGFNSPDWSSPAHGPRQFVHGPSMRLYAKGAHGHHPSGRLCQSSGQAAWHPYYDLWALGTASDLPESELRDLAQAHFL